MNRFISDPREFILGWFRDLTFRSLVQNTGWLLSGNIIAALLGLPVTVFRARALGIEEFGLFSLVVAYVALVNQFSTFRPWQALIKYGAETLKENRYQDFMSQVKLSFLLDTIGAVSGTLIAIAAAYLFASWQVYSLNTSHMMALLSISILFDISGTPIGILRLLDRYKLQTTHNVLTNLLSLVGAGYVFLSGGGIWGFLVVLMISNVVGNLVLLVMAIVALQQRGLIHYWRAPIKEWRPLLRFSLWTYASTTLDIPIKQLDIIIVSSVISLEAAGIYKVIKQVTQVLSLLADPVYQAIYPQFSTMIAGHENGRAVKYAIKLGSLLLAVTGIPALLLAATSFWWLKTIFGGEFAAGALPMSLFLLLKVISIALVTIHPLFTAMGFVKQTTIILLLANLFFLASAWQFGNDFGLLGLALASAIQLSIVVGLKAIYIARDSPKFDEAYL